jgi:hypothetical protein
MAHVKRESGSVVAWLRQDGGIDNPARPRGPGLELQRVENFLNSQTIIISDSDQCDVAVDWDRLARLQRECLDIGCRLETALQQKKQITAGMSGDSVPSKEKAEIRLRCQQTVNLKAELRTASDKRNRYLDAAIAIGSRKMESEEHQAPSIIVEIDLTGPAAMRYLDGGPDLYVLLEEAYPGDPGQLSGVRLQLAHSGEDAFLNVVFAAPQPNHPDGSHTFGLLDAAELASLASLSREESCRFNLHELYSEDTGRAFSGATLSLRGGENPELRVKFGHHCMGVLRGEALAMFILCVRARCKGAEPCRS